MNPKTVRLQASLDQLWEDAVNNVSIDPEKAARLHKVLKMVANGEAVPDISLDGPEMRVVCYFAQLSVAECFVRLSKRGEE